MLVLTRNQWNMLLAGVLLFGTIFIAATRVGPPQSTAAPATTSGASRAPAPLADHPAPDFALPDLDGSNVALSGLKGQVALINIWATWCPPCRAEMPTIQAAYEQYRA